MKKLIDFFSTLRQGVINIFEVVIRKIFLRDRSRFYDKYFGSDNTFVLFLKNSLRPKPLVKKIQFGQLPYHLGIGKPLHQLDPDYRELAREGIVSFPALYPGLADEILEHYDFEREILENSGKYSRIGVGIDHSDILSVVVNDKILSLLEMRYKRQPYLRQLPRVNSTFPRKEDREKRAEFGYNTNWHYDTPNQMTAHLLLNDVGEDSCHMLYAKKSHLKMRTNLNQDDYFYSEEYVRGKYELFKCIGPKGTLIVFDPNGLHRLNIVEDTHRMHLHLNYTPGNDIIFEKDFMNPKKGKSVDYSKLSPIQKETVKNFV